MVSEEYCRLLKKAGCFSVSIAIECGNEHLRNSVLKRNVTDEQIFNACEYLKRYGIRILTFNMIGIPGEAELDICRTIEINQQAGVDFADVSIFQPYPGTDVYEYCRKEGYLDNITEKYECQFSRSILKVSPDYLKKIFIFHRLFSIIVDYPKLKSLVGLFFKIKWNKVILDFMSKLYFGFNMEKRIFASKMKFKIRAYGAFILLFSRDR